MKLIENPINFGTFLVATIGVCIGIMYIPYGDFYHKLIAMVATFLFVSFVVLVLYGIELNGKIKEVENENQIITNEYNNLTEKHNQVTSAYNQLYQNAEAIIIQLNNENQLTKKQKEELDIKLKQAEEKAKELEKYKPVSLPNQLLGTTYIKSGLGAKLLEGWVTDPTKLSKTLQ
ncbi:MAG: hypothetical protein A2Y25_09225 [Candidatus Melainabacteria bacterium GWF2_37_15]|nr:MAG: hypothetical protein A2Y25_09225 [Candidatus Melainabacteria bacterium GWF2_37_15]